MARASYASYWEQSRGRLFAEAASGNRTPFQRDRDRIIHATAFRRLMHKTQVFVAPDLDHFRTRLTHSLEVAQIARSLARSLGADEDLTEAIALAHDLGHTPFGHTGEDALHELMLPFGGFDHNDQALRILTLLEHRYPQFDGLNLTWECLDGVIKHNGPLQGPHARAKDSKKPLPPTVAAIQAQADFELADHSGIEAQIAAIADDIAYNHHDMDDGLRAGLFTLEDVCAAVPHVGDCMAGIYAQYPKARRTTQIAEMVRRLIGDMVADILQGVGQQIRELPISNSHDIRKLGRQLVQFSPAMAAKEKSLKSFLFKHMYRAPSVNRERETAYIIVGGLFRHFIGDPKRLPAEWQSLCQGPFDPATARAVADYIAGMTDRFAKRLHQDLKG